jgi:hypothetical protein
LSTAPSNQHTKSSTSASHILDLTFLFKITI